jgi:hypothetical protein
VRNAGSGVCVAVGNADESLKEAADYIARSVDDTPGGFTDAMEHYQLVYSDPSLRISNIFIKVVCKIHTTT